MTARRRPWFEAIRVVKSTWKERPFRAGSWLVAAILVWQLVYVPMHLLLECHYEHEPPHAQLHAAAKHDFTAVTDDHCNNTHGSGHVPHCISNHTLPVTHSTPVAAAHLDLMLPAVAMEIQHCAHRSRLSVFKRGSPPSRPPPGPSLPRAPPQA